MALAEAWQVTANKNSVHIHTNNTMHISLLKNLHTILQLNLKKER